MQHYAAMSNNQRVSTTEFKIQLLFTICVAEADRVLRIDPETDRVETIGDPLPGRWKWYGGILAEDDCTS